jgi:Mrp family chromosome partitioning ATPase
VSQLDTLVPTEHGARVSFDRPRPVAAEIRDAALAAQALPGAPAFETFRVLRTKLKTSLPAAPGTARCLGLVSATRGEGTSSVALGLAGALAQEPDARVLLIEAGLRQPTLAHQLGLEDEAGLSDWLAGGGQGPVPLRQVAPWNFALLTGGRPTASSAELLGSDALKRLLSSARHSFDAVLVDCPPLETQADAVVLQEFLDGFLLVVRSRHAPADVVRRSVSHLKPGVVRGVVFNDRTDPLGRWLDRRSRTKP